MIHGKISSKLSFEYEMKILVVDKIFVCASELNKRGGGRRDDQGSFYTASSI